jgi:DNA-binding Lrp family transcriptional regulator
MNSLSDSQRVVLGALSTHGHLQIRELASLCGLKEHTFRHTLNRCQQQRLFTEYRQVNFATFGLQTFNFYFSLPHRIPDEALELLRTDPRVVWLAENASEGRFEMTIVCRSPSQLLEFCTSLSHKTSISFTNPAWAIELSFIFFGDRFLAPHLPHHLVEVDLTAAPCSWDDLDVRILDALCSDSSAAVNQLARVLGQPASSVDYRIKRLLSQGVITPPLYSANSQTVGCAECQLLLSFRYLSAQLDRLVTDFCVRHARVFKLVRAFGSWNYKILARADTTEDLLLLRERLEIEFADSLASAQFMTRRRILRFTPALASHPELRV